eukprot:gene32710-3594_t
MLHPLNQRNVVLDVLSSHLLEPPPHDIACILAVGTSRMCTSAALCHPNPVDHGQLQDPSGSLHVHTWSNEMFLVKEDELHVCNMELHFELVPAPSTRKWAHVGDAIPLLKASMCITQDMQEQLLKGSRALLKLALYRPSGQRQNRGAQPLGQRPSSGSSSAAPQNQGYLNVELRMQLTDIDVAVEAGLPADLLPCVRMEGTGIPPGSTLQSRVGTLYVEPAVVLMRFRLLKMVGLQQVHLQETAGHREAQHAASSSLGTHMAQAAQEHFQKLGDKFKSWFGSSDRTDGKSEEDDSWAQLDRGSSASSSRNQAAQEGAGNISSRASSLSNPKATAREKGMKPRLMDMPLPSSPPAPENFRADDRAGRANSLLAAHAKRKTGQPHGKSSGGTDSTNVPSGMSDGGSSEDGGARGPHLHHAATACPAPSKKRTESGSDADVSDVSFRRENSMSAPLLPPFSPVKHGRKSSVDYEQVMTAMERGGFSHTVEKRPECGLYYCKFVMAAARPLDDSKLSIVIYGAKDARSRGKTYCQISAPLSSMLAAADVPLGNPSALLAQGKHKADYDPILWPSGVMNLQGKLYDGTDVELTVEISLVDSDNQAKEWDLPVALKETRDWESNLDGRGHEEGECDLPPFPGSPHNCSPGSMKWVQKTQGNPVIGLVRVSRHDDGASRSSSSSSVRQNEKGPQQTSTEKDNGQIGECGPPSSTHLGEKGKSSIRSRVQPSQIGMLHLIVHDVEFANCSGGTTGPITADISLITRISSIKTELAHNPVSQIVNVRAMMGAWASSSEQLVGKLRLRVSTLLPGKFYAAVVLPLMGERSQAKGGEVTAKVTLSLLATYPSSSILLGSYFTPPLHPNIQLLSMGCRPACRLVDNGRKEFFLSRLRQNDARLKMATAALRPLQDWRCKGTAVFMLLLVAGLVHMRSKALASGSLGKPAAMLEDFPEDFADNDSQEQNTFQRRNSLESTSSVDGRLSVDAPSTSAATALMPEADQNRTSQSAAVGPQDVFNSLKGQYDAAIGFLSTDLRPPFLRDPLPPPPANLVSMFV